MLKLVVLGLLAFIVSLVITAPARVAISYLPPAVHASGLHGTLWEGQAHRLTVHGFDLGEAQWQLRPLALLTGRLQSDVDVNHPDLQGQGTLSIGLNGLGVADTHAVGNSRLLAPYLSDYGVDIDGRFELNARNMQFSKNGPQAMDGTLVWQDAQLLSPGKLALGDVNAVLKQDGDAAIAVLTNSGDALRLNGEARLQPGWSYQARLRLAPTANTPQEVRNSLPFLGQPDASGAVTINRQGALTRLAALDGSPGRQERRPQQQR
jgi:general secretion pathway protein N